MTATEPQLIQMLDVGTGAARRCIAYLHRPPVKDGAPSLLWLTGLKSDMVSTKAEALSVWARERGLGMTRFDYSGHGRSDGRFEDAVISDWLSEALAIFTRVMHGPVILVGSSTGGHVALLILHRLLASGDLEAQRIAGLVLIAPAWDLTEELMWKAFSQDARHDIMTKGQWVRPSTYDPPGYIITRRFIEDGRENLIGTAPFNPGRPISIMQGLLDTDVPAAHTQRLLTLLEGGWAKVCFVPDGGHRLSRPEDLDKLYALIEEQVAHYSSKDT
ncbi:MAG: alpha/beta fold hydrolase [Hyphomicrobium sp.]